MPNTDGTILSRWHTTLENVICSPLEFYESVMNSIEQKGIPNITFTNITRREGGWFSSHSRIYLRIRQNRLFFDVCAFPVGTSFVVSSWLQEDLPGAVDLLAEIPVLGYVLENTLLANSFYTVDFVEYYQRSIHNSVLQIIDDLTDDFELERIPNEARQPILTEFFR